MLTVWTAIEYLMEQVPPVPKGFDISEILEIMDRILASNKVICLEVVEVNPLLDRKGNKMAEAAFEILERATNQIMEI